MRTVGLTLGNGGWLELDRLPTIGNPGPPPALILRVKGPLGGQLQSVILTPAEAAGLAGCLLGEADELSGTDLAGGLRRVIFQHLGEQRLAEG